MNGEGTCDLEATRKTCEDKISDDFRHEEEIVMRLEKEHQEPVYPTWRKYLTEIGVIKEPFIPAIGRDESYIIDGFAYSESYALTNTRISADIAEKLGLKPEET